MSKRKFEVGDVVRLKSGGPAMTVAQNMDGDAVRVIWFSGQEGAWTNVNNGGQGVFSEFVLDFYDNRPAKGKSKAKPEAATE